MPTPANSPATREALTNWDVFTRLRLMPVTIRCQGYKPLHAHDASCHTTVKPAVENMLSHIANGHGGGFYLKVRQQPEGAKPWTGWEDLKRLGVEVVDMRFEGSGRGFEPSAQTIVPFLTPQHRDRHLVDGGQFNLTLSLPKAAPAQPVDEQ